MLQHISKLLTGKKKKSAVPSLPPPVKEPGVISTTLGRGVGDIFKGKWTASPTQSLFSDWLKELTYPEKLTKRERDLDKITSGEG